MGRLDINMELKGPYYEYVENIQTDIVGSILDLETIGEFSRGGAVNNAFAEYREIKITTVGVLTRDKIVIRIANGQNALSEFQELAVEMILDTKRPLYAFNKRFEEGCFYWASGGRRLIIEHELQRFPREKKENVVRMLGIDSFGDPYHGEGRRCVVAFAAGDLESIVRHNRSCLLKEAQILKKRGALKIAL